MRENKKRRERDREREEERNYMGKEKSTERKGNRTRMCVANIGTRGILQKDVHRLT
jgi:hypothetical protein